MAVKFIEGVKPCSDAKVGIVVSRFNIGRLDGQLTCG